MNVSFSSFVSGIRAAVTRHDITAHDVANVNTAGYEERRPHQVATQPSGTKISHVSTTANPNTQRSNTDLAEETKEQIVNKNTLAANARGITVQDEMLKTTIDLLA